MAELLGVSPSTVQRWLKTGVPGKWCGRPSEYPDRVRRLFEGIEKSLGEEQTFAELLKLAGEAEVLPNIASSEGKYSGKAVDGWQWTRRIQRKLASDVIEMMATWASARRGRPQWPFWMITVMTSQYALTSRHGFGAASRADNYKTVIVQLGHVKAGDFAVSRPEPTGAHRTKDAAVGHMVELFEEMLADQELMVFVHAVTVYTWRKRTPEERRAYESDQRRKRKRK